MKWTKVPVQLKKKKIHIKKFETQNLRRDTAALVLVEDTKVTNEEEGKCRCKSIDEDVIKFKSMKCKNRGDKTRVVKNKQEKIIKNEK